MFAQALDMSLRQLAQTTKGLNEAKKQRSRPDFKANPAGFDGGVELLRSRAQEVMMVTQALMQKASGSLPELQLAVTDAIMKLQELALDTKSLSSSVVDPADRECLFQSVMSMIGGLESLLKQLRQVAGKGKDVTKPAIKPLVKDVIKAIGSVLDVLDATEAQQAKLMEARQKAAEVEVEKQRDTMLDSARKIAQVAKDLAAMSKKAAPAHQV
ncbi:hypothetical protein SARC_09728 [Sphaeroforma arctica JP610]|uniref:Uncharacterized protein n=1 Tax=Sphaeroforma arctica JP610 TaxID=667725 RepID=A0A0L0FM38_9EUKA|nr:hypothetical protein SARC_09728 [Sphaeroforma arctica JP610]KNC77825.1 hypothetical protein SARC_09728 [Sphaeroforma arctica JP610]|eukprot:XP_014151727.1 hypothetical protein SARC_09728 [Sphaeroforma arctica JP610]